MMKTPVYLDNHSTTPVDERVLAEMLPYFSEHFGNASSADHAFGWKAEEAVDRARQRVAALIGASADEIVFTSGATESNNLAIKGAVDGATEVRIVTSATEHPAVLDPCEYLEGKGAKVRYLPVDRDGLLDLKDVEKSLDDDVRLVSVMMANNEIGVLQPIAEIGELCRARDILFHTDAAQAVGKVPVDVQTLKVDLLSLSAHKMYGPKGVGALYVSKNARRKIAAKTHGGGHEGSLRSGTVNVAGVVGMGMACELSGADMAAESVRTGRLRDRLRDSILARLDEVHVNGHPTNRLPGNLNLSFGFVEGEALILSMEDVAVSSGSACTSATNATSHVLAALGVPEQLLHSSIRFGLGRFNTEEEIDYVVDKICASVTRLRELSPLWDKAQREKT